MQPWTSRPQHERSEHRPVRLDVRRGRPVRLWVDGDTWERVLAVEEAYVIEGRWWVGGESRYYLRLRTARRVLTVWQREPPNDGVSAWCMLRTED
jgi:hypothetical protein